MSEFDLSFYKGKKVFVTGHTGFKGSWLCKILANLGAEVTGYSLNPPTEPSLFDIANIEKDIKSVIGDIRDYASLKKAFDEAQPDIVLHLAAQPIVRDSYKDPAYTYETNVIGTVNILECVRNSSCVKSFLNVTTDKVYLNKEWNWGYRENEELDGFDPYSNSKSCSELVTHSYKNSFFADGKVAISTARAGNVIGGGDWAKDRIIVDCVKAFSKGETVEIRCPKATRPWQHVLEPLSGYLTLGQYLYENKSENGEAYNFGPRAEQTKTVFELTQDLAEEWGLDKEKASKLTGNVTFKEATLLKLNCDKALAYLNWHSTLHYEQCVHIIAEWYKAFYEGKNVDMFDLTKKQIEYYTEEAESQNLNWTK